MISGKGLFNLRMGGDSQIENHWPRASEKTCSIEDLLRSEWTKGVTTTGDCVDCKLMLIVVM